MAKRKKNIKKQKKKNPVTKKSTKKKKNRKTNVKQSTGKKKVSKGQKTPPKKNNTKKVNTNAKKTTTTNKKPKESLKKPKTTIEKKKITAKKETKKKEEGWVLYKKIFQEKRKEYEKRILNKLAKKKSLSKKTKKRFICISILCLIIALLLMFPYGTTEYKSEASGKILKIPKLSKLSEECCSYQATFTSIRSYTVLKMELQQILDQYEKLNCDGKNYFYNKEEDFTITGYQLKRGFLFNTFAITYGHGNSCEMNTSLKNIELLPDDYSLEEAKKDGVYVIDTDAVYNASSYEKFLEDIKSQVPSTLRIAKLTTEGDLILIDVKTLSDGKFKIIYDGTRDRMDSEDDRVMLAYIYDHIGIYKDKLYAYNGSKITNSLLNTTDVYYLFDVT